MLKKVKKWLGIEGVKLELMVPDEVKSVSKKIEGKIKFSSMHTQAVKSMRIVMIERYSRGRGKEQLIDEYLIGEINIEKTIQVAENQPVEVKFTLPFIQVESEMDEFENKNFLSRGIAKLAKLANKVKSEYRIEAEAEVEGTALNPFDKVVVKLV